MADAGGLLMLQQTGEFLANSGSDLVLRPVLAESWTPNQDGSVWTFKIRKGVKFHNGATMTADDVVATIDRLADPKNASNALSAFTGVLSKGGAKKIDDETVEFHLDAPNGNFPYYLSSDNYNAIILPKDYAGDFEKNFIGTGPFKLEKYTPKVGASFTRNEDYWGPKARAGAHGVRLLFRYPLPGAGAPGPSDRHHQPASHVPGNRAGERSERQSDQLQMQLPQPGAYAHRHGALHRQAGPARGRALPRPGEARERPVPRQGGHRQRQPLRPGLPLDRHLGAAAPADIAQAKELMAAAGMADGFKVKLTTEKYLELPDYAVVIQNAVKPIGIDIELNVETQDAYYGKAVFGQSDWLDLVMGITDYGHRGVPNVLMTAPLKSDGTWNSAHFKNKDYDSLVTQYISSADLQTQRQIAGKIETLLLDETPVIFAYFYDYMLATAKQATGVQATAMGQLFLANASLG